MSGSQVPGNLSPAEALQGIHETREALERIDRFFRDLAANPNSPLSRMAQSTAVLRERLLVDIEELERLVSAG